MSVGIRVLLIPVLLLSMSALVEAANNVPPVLWSVKMGGTENSIVITVVPNVRIKDVRCELKLLDGSRRQIGTYTARFANQDDASLAPGVEHTETFTLDQSGVEHVEGLLLFAKPALSSPKAAAGSSAGALGRGVPPQGSSR